MANTIREDFRSTLVVDIFPEDALACFDRVRPGGIAVRRRFTQSPEQVAALIDAHQRRSGVPLMVAANFEWGVANDVCDCRSYFPGAMALSAACPGNDLTLAARQARAIAREAAALGVNTIFGPVMDPVPAKQATDSGTRSFSSNSQRLAEYARAYTHGMQAEGVCAVAKHFPGAHAPVDAHLDLATVNLDLRALQRRSLVPFAAAVEAGVTGMMIQHNAYPRITRDRLPATMSPAIYDLLRNRMGFQGFIITDNMSMGAIARHFSPEEALLAPLRAGADLVLVRSTTATPELLERCERIIARDPALQERIRMAQARLAPLRRRWAKPQARRDYRRLEQRNIALASEIATRAVTVLRDAHGLLPVTAPRYRRVLLVSPQARNGYHVALPSNFGYLAMEIKQSLPEAELMFISDDPPAAERRAVLRRCADADVIILVVHEEPGIHGLAAGQVALCRQTIQAAGRRLILAGLTAPLFLKRLPAGGAAIFAFSAMPSSQQALARAILGSPLPARQKAPRKNVASSSRTI
jgi:beta-N-acetylhexosaminidase